MDTDQSIIISLTQGQYAVIDPENYGLIRGVCWWLHNGYAAGHKPGSGGRGKNVPMHRVIMSARPGERIDHIDGDPLNNHRSNLRRCTNAQNIRNQRLHTTGKRTSRFKGVYRMKNGKWRAQIMCQYRKINLGTFLDEEAAAREYDVNARKLHGEFARVNFREVVRPKGFGPLTSASGGRRSIQLS